MITPPDSMLDESLLGLQPWPLFGQWLAEAAHAQFPDFDAMTLATATPEGRPSARIVLLRGFDERGIVFYTNYRSRKGDELTANPRAALVLFWPAFKRQVRIEGNVSVVTAAESDEYFASRPRGHRFGALISPQSQVIPDRSFLDRRLEELQQQYPADVEIPRPPHWGGFRVAPSSIEFWQGRDNRLHDRIRFVRQDDGWKRERLAP